MEYWEMHDILFENQEAWTADPPQPKTAAQATELMMQYGQRLGLDMEKFKNAVDSRKFNEKLSRDMADGEKLEVTGTPTFFVNGKKAQSFAELSTLIDVELAK
jgi:protein-disulfide isomerase